MFATTYSLQQFPASGRKNPPRWRLLALTLLVIAGFNLRAQTNQTSQPPDPSRFVAHAAQVLATAQEHLHREPTNSAAALEFGRAVFERAEFATNDTERATLAQRGIASCRKLTARESNSAPAHYYLAMNLGQLARTKSLGALPIVDEMEREFKIARQLDERISFAGPDRNLGLLYLQAPGWPTSIGSRSKARKHLERAVELAPDHPENRLNLIEAYLKWSDRNGARREMKSLEALWPAARANLAGEAWASDWADWESRLEKARKKIEKLSQPVESPRNKN
jgi:tetratricopeptide (TPR) repeat protein